MRSASITDRHEEARVETEENERSRSWGTNLLNDTLSRALTTQSHKPFKHSIDLRTRLEMFELCELVITC